ncbi:hypothetical protein [Spirosoma gilvum]
MNASLIINNLLYPWPSPGHTCYTRPASSTGSLWKGYGGWLFRICTFALLKRDPNRKTHRIRKACYAMRVDENTYLSQPMVSRRIRSRNPFWHWDRIDETLHIDSIGRWPQRAA